MSLHHSHGLRVMFWWHQRRYGSPADHVLYERERGGLNQPRHSLSRSDPVHDYTPGHHSTVVA
jgi:hypothetical protein